jgi:CheY-like chemotaxis protein
MMFHGTALLVDDEKQVLRALQKALERIGFHVLTATDGRQAVDTFRSHADDIVLVLLDNSMPHLSGDEALAEIRTIRADVPAILSSGYSQEELAARGEGKGFDGCLQKPYQLATLRQAVDEVLSRPSTASAD